MINTQRNLSIKVTNKCLIGEDHPTFIIAEAGINHNGDFETAKELIKKAKECYKSYIKLYPADYEIVQRLGKLKNI